MALTASIVVAIAAGGRSTSTGGTGSYMGALADPPVTRAQVRAMVRGAARDGLGSSVPRPAADRSEDAGAAADPSSVDPGPGLLAQVLRTAEARFWTGPFPLELRAAFIGPVATQSTAVRTRGWPVAWSTRTEVRRHDADDRVRPIATDPTRPSASGFGMSLDAAGSIPPRPRWEWARSHLLHGPPPEETDGVVVRTVYRPAAIGLPVALSLAAMLLVVMALAVIERVRRRALPERVRRVVVGSSVAVAALALAAALVSGDEMRQRGVDRFALPPHERSAVFGLEHRPTNVDLRALGRLAAVDEAAALRAVAAGIVEATEDDEGGSITPHDLLSLQIDMRGSARTSGTSIESPLVLGSIAAKTWIDPSDGGERVVAAPKGTHVEVKQGVLVVERSDGLAETPSRQLVVLLAEVGLVLLVVLASGGMATALLHLGARRRASRRFRDGRCVGCGYRFGPAAVARERR